MEGRVTHILGIAPYDGMQTAMERVAEEFPNIQLDAYTGDLEAGAAIVRSAQLENYDVIISRGGTADRIREVTDLPVVSIQLSVYDVLRAIKMAENYSNLYAIVGFPSITEPAHTLCDLLRLDMDIITIHSMDETNRALDRLREGGYKMVVSDMVTHTLARQKGFDAFLITSGVESLHDAFAQAVQISDRFRQMRRQNQLLEGVARTRSGNTIVLDKDGQLAYAAKEKPDPRLLELLRSKIPDIPPASPLRFFHSEGGEFTRVTAHRLRAGWDSYYTFHCQLSQIPLRSSKNGLRFFDEAEAMQQFMHSFYSISGAMGMLEEQVNAIAPTRQPVMILGEVGTGKEQIARALYLRSPRVNSPLAVVDCSLMTDKNWEYLFNHYASPLNEGSCTVYFQHLELLAHQYQQELLAVATETNLPRRVRLLFSAACIEGRPLPEPVQVLRSQLGCLTLQLPTLRSRRDELPSLASLYLSSLNAELGKQIIGFDPRASEQLLQYEWPNNYTQFKQVLQELVTLTDSAYIRGSVVAEVLARERRTYHSDPAAAPAASGAASGTLDEIVLQAIHQTLDAVGGNQTAAAKRLGISRTTLWRYLNPQKAAQPKK